MDSAGRAVVFAGTTVMISMLGLLLVGVGSVGGMGIGVSATVLATMFTSTTLLPALLGFARERVELTRWRGLIAAGFTSVALLGLAFKPNTDDMRDAPSIAIVQALEDAGVKVRGYDPESMEQARPIMPNVAFCSGPYEAAHGADAVVLVTEWDALRALDLDRLAAAMRHKVLIDLRNIYPPEEVEMAGLVWHGIGRPARALRGGGS